MTIANNPATVLGCRIGAAIPADAPAAAPAAAAADLTNPNPELIARAKLAALQIYQHRKPANKAEAVQVLWETAAGEAYEQHQQLEKETTEQ